METNANQSVVLDADHSLFLRQLNERNQQFWLEQPKLFFEQFAIEAVSNRAPHDLEEGSASRSATQEPSNP